MCACTKERADGQGARRKGRECRFSRISRGRAIAAATPAGQTLASILDVPTKSSWGPWLSFSSQSWHIG